MTARACVIAATAKSMEQVPPSDVQREGALCEPLAYSGRMVNYFHCMFALIAVSVLKQSQSRFISRLAAPRPTMGR